MDTTICLARRYARTGRETGEEPARKPDTPRRHQRAQALAGRTGEEAGGRE
mgnify:CR=1 FL=1